MRDLTHYVVEVAYGSWSFVSHNIGSIARVHLARGELDLALNVLKTYVSRLDEEELRRELHGIPYPVGMLLRDSIKRFTGYPGQFAHSELTSFIEHLLTITGDEGRKEFLRAIWHHAEDAIPARALSDRDAEDAWQDMYLGWLAQIDPAQGLPKYAQHFLSQAKYGEALKQYRQLAEVEPTSPAGFAGMARCYESLRDLEAAKDFIDKAVELSDSNSKPELLARQGALMRSTGAYASAISSYTEALRADPAHSAAHEWYRDRGFCYEQLGDFDLALDDYRNQNRLRRDDEGFDRSLKRVQAAKAKGDQAPKAGPSSVDPPQVHHAEEAVRRMTEDWRRVD